MNRMGRAVAALAVFCAFFSLCAVYVRAAEEKINVNQAGQAEFYDSPE